MKLSPGSSFIQTAIPQFQPILALLKDARLWRDVNAKELGVWGRYAERSNLSLVFIARWNSWWFKFGYKYGHDPLQLMALRNKRPIHSELPPNQR
jgi:hypothetical protein